MASVSDLRIVLIGKNGSENRRMANTILGRAVFDSEAPYYSQQHSDRISGELEERKITVINTHLLQPNFPQGVIIDGVRECVSLSAPGPHVFVLVLQYNNFNENDRHRVKYVLNLFSYQAMKHTIVLTTDDEPRESTLTSKNNTIHDLIKECGGGHLKFDTGNTGWHSEMFRRIEEILKKESIEFLICDMCEDEDETQVDEDLRRSGASVREEDKEEDSDLKESTKTTSDGGVRTTGKAKLNIVLCGNNSTLKNSVSRIFRGVTTKPQKEMSNVFVKSEEKIDGRQISVIELPALSRLSEEEVMRHTHRCLFLCDPGVHVFILVTPVTTLTNKDRAEMKKIKGIYNSNEHFMVLFITELTVDESVSDFVESTESQRIVSLYGSWYSVMGLKDQRNSEQISKLFDRIESMKTKPYSLQMYMRALNKRVSHELVEKLRVIENEIKELQKKIKTLGLRVRDNEVIEQQEKSKTLGAESSSGQSTSGYADVFTPECVQQADEDKHKTIYRFVCPHAGQFQCSLTSLVFVMASEGEVLYRVVSWNPGLLDGLGQMKPAGPLYNIDCFNGSVSGLHLPHCEIFCEENKDSLAVARFTGGNVEIMKPLKVSETHVIIDIRDLSHFGLLKRMIFPPSPVSAQVLLFLRPITERQRENILDVHLLPSNVPLSKVKDQYTENKHIITSSKCSLTPESEYCLCCQTEGSTVQPGSETFECNYGPNYHPTFEVFVDVNKREIRLSLLDKTGKEVWEPRRILLTGRDVEPPAYRRLTECEFVERHGNELIRRVSSVMAIADGLRTKKMIPDEMYSKVHAAEPRQEKTRLLLDAVYSGGAAVKAEFFILLTNEEPHLVDELESGPSRPQQF